MQPQQPSEHTPPSNANYPGRTVFTPASAPPPPPPGSPQQSTIEPNGMPGVGVIPPQKPSRRKLFVIVGAATVFVAGLATYAFAYYLPNKPENVWQSALSRTGEGYQRLVDYASSDKVAKRYKTADVEGAFTYDSEGFATDGTIKASMDDKNGTFSADMGLGITRLTLDGVVKDAANSDSPDLYVKTGGIKGLGALYGLPQLDSLDGQWITLDHSFFDSFIQGSESVAFGMPTDEDVTGAAEVLGRVSNKYLFTADKSNAVLAMREYVGKEQVDGKETMHYKVAVNKTNLTRYLEELGTELDKTTLNDWAQSSYSKSLSELLELEEAQKAAGRLNGSEPIDAWVNTKTKMLRQVRFADTKQPDTNYAELIFDYDGGDELPFGLNVRSTVDETDVTASFDLTLNMDTDIMTLKGDIKDDAETTKSTGSFDLTIKPGSGDVAAEVPAGAISLSEALNMIGLNEYFNSLLGQVEASLQEDLTESL